MIKNFFTQFSPSYARVLSLFIKHPVYIFKKILKVYVHSQSTVPYKSLITTINLKNTQIYINT